MTTKAAAQQLLSHLGVSTSGEATELAEFFMKNQLPITKDTFQSAMQWMKNIDSFQAGLPILKTMYAQQLPFVEDVFKALYVHTQGDSLNEMLRQLLAKLNVSDTETASSVQLKGLIESLISPKQGQIQETGLLKLIGHWLDSNASPTSQAGAYSLLQKTGLISANMSESEFFLHLLNDSQTSETSSAKFNLQNRLQQEVQMSGEAPKGDGSNLVRKALERILNDVQQGRMGGAFQGKAAVNELLSFLHSDGQQMNQVKSEILNQLRLLVQNGESKLLSNERAILQQLASEFSGIDMSKAADVFTYLKEITRMLGVQFEHVLAKAQDMNSENLNDELTTLKPLLLQLLHEEHSTSTKELADQIVSRITAQQILSNENGPLQNVLLSLPLNIGNYQTDVTLEWSGRKRKDGSIDPNYCRILFYLDLEQLKETIIDMQVQNRVIKIVVLNEQSNLIQAAAGSYINLLRSNLEQMDYTLSGVVFESTINTPKIEGSRKDISTITSSYNGVDIRI